MNPAENGADIERTGVFALSDEQIDDSMDSTISKDETVSHGNDAHFMTLIARIILIVLIEQKTSRNYTD